MSLELPVLWEQTLWTPSALRLRCGLNSITGKLGYKKKKRLYAVAVVICNSWCKENTQGPLLKDYYVKLTTAAL